MILTCDKCKKDFLSECESYFVEVSNKGTELVCHICLAEKNKKNWHLIGEVSKLAINLYNHCIISNKEANLLPEILYNIIINREVDNHEDLMKLAWKRLGLKCVPNLLIIDTSQQYDLEEYLYG